MTSIRRRVLYLVLLGRRVVVSFLHDSGMTWAAATAFYLALSVPPLLIALTSIAVALIGEQTAREVATQRLNQLMPAENPQLESVVESTVTGLGPAAVASLGFLLLSGTRFFAALSRAINTFWSHVEDVGWVRRQLSRGLLLLVVGGLFGASLALELGAAIVGRDVELPAVAGWLLRSQVLPALLIFGALLATFKLLPHNAARWRSALIGAVVGTLMLRVAQALFTLFLTTIADFGSAYGPLAGIAVLMTWALIASAAVLLAAELVAVLDRRRIPGRKASDGRHRERRGDPGTERGRRAALHS